MNVLLWILQVLLALHTVMGALWKLAGKTDPSLSAIPHSVWMAMSVFELLCAVALILPAFKKSLAGLAPLAAACIAAEMLIFSALNLLSASGDHAHVIYWLVVASICAVIAYGRFARKPILAV